MFNIFMIRFKSISYLIACNMWKENIRLNIYIIGMAVGLGPKHVWICFDLTRDKESWLSQRKFPFLPPPPPSKSDSQRTKSREWLSSNNFRLYSSLHIFQKLSNLWLPQIVIHSEYFNIFWGFDNFSKTFLI